MLPTIDIFGFQLPMYLTMAVIGGIAASLLGVFLARRTKDIRGEDVFFMLLYAGIGCIIGAKLLYILVSVRVYWNPDYDVKVNLYYWYLVLTSGGLVFYGGLIGAFLGAVRYTRHFKLNTFKHLETIIPCVPLFHAFGRIGCFCAGCCYGMEYDGFGAICFDHSEVAPNHVELFPSQLISAGFNFLLAFALLLLWFKWKSRPHGVLCGLYLAIYAAGRFTIEFFRGDEERGRLLSLSTSQWISIFVMTAGIIVLIYAFKHKNSDETALITDKKEENV